MNAPTKRAEASLRYDQVFMYLGKLTQLGHFPWQLERPIFLVTIWMFSTVVNANATRFHSMAWHGMAGLHAMTGAPPDPLSASLEPRFPLRQEQLAQHA